jgi:DNA mismatch repair ATPase MutS
MHRDRDMPADAPLGGSADAVRQDLNVVTVIDAMAAGDRFLADIAQTALLGDPLTEVADVRYRQDVMADALACPAVIRHLYDIAVAAIEARRRGPYFGLVGRYPSGVLYGAVELLQMLVDFLRQLRDVAAEHAHRFASRGFTRFFTMLQQELDDAYLQTVLHHVDTLRFRRGVLLSAQLGSHNDGANYVLHQPEGAQPTWVERLLGRRAPAYTFHIDPRDDAGARALSELRDRGVNVVANAAAQSAEHILGFFESLRRELAFYVGALNLHDRLAAIGARVALPEPCAIASGVLRYDNLYDVGLALTLSARPVGNCVDASGKRLVIITGANQGGKSSLLRGIGLAHLMMQCGLFVSADAFAASLPVALFTHYKREEDPTMTSGKLDEELRRLSAMVDAIRPGSLVLLNESFAATNEREGSEIARQVVSALVECGIHVCFVTHLYDFARSLCAGGDPGTLCLRAERLPDGTRTFKVAPGEPLETSYGEDLYRRVFETPASASTAHASGEQRGPRV